jgi:predicted aminopeptidase
MATAKRLILRSEYLAPGQADRMAAHRAYYAQLVTPAHFDRLRKRVGMVDRIKKSQDKHFNDIPLSVWDLMAASVPAETARIMRECGDYPTLAGAVCILKEAAQQVREGSANV